MSNVSGTDNMIDHEVIFNIRNLLRFMTTKTLQQLQAKDMHTWGKQNNFKAKSPTLRQLIEAKNSSSGEEFKIGTNSTETFQKILNELQLGFQIRQLTTRQDNTTDFCMSINVKSTPRFTFCGLAPSEEEAMEEASKKGIEYFIDVTA